MLPRIDGQHFEVTWVKIGQNVRNLGKPKRKLQAIFNPKGA